MNNASRRFILVSLFAFSLQASAETQSLEDDFARLLSWFPGEYDNYEQNWQDKLDQVEQVHEHINHIFYPVAAPAVGKHTFFVQQYMDGDPANAYRRRFYSFSLDDSLDNEEHAIRLDIFSFNDEEKYADAHLTPELLKGLSAADLTGRPGCEVYWKYTGEFFHGYMKENACRVKSQRSGKEIFITDDLKLTPDEIWIRDEAFFADGTRVFGNVAGVHHKNRKVQYYTGWGAVTNSGPGIEFNDENWVQKDNDWEFVGDLEHFSRFVIHNEGQIVPVLSEDGSPSGYSVQLAKLTYANTSVPILTLKIREDATGKTRAYSWAETGAERIGINTCWA